MTKLARWLPAIVAVLFTASETLACSVCQGNPDSELTQGAKAGVIFLAIVTYSLLFGVAGIFVTWMVRARRMGDQF